MLAAAAGNVIQAAQTHWHFHGGDLAETISESLEVLESGLGVDPRKWSAAERPKSPGWGQPANRRKGRESGSDVGRSVALRLIIEDFVSLVGSPL